MNIKAQKDTKSAVHHWWPKGVSKFWKDDDGYVHQINPTGKVLRTNHAKFGGIKNAHILKFGEGPSPWDMSFENYFDEIDSGLPELCNFLEGLERNPLNMKHSLSKRVLPIDVEDSILNEISSAMVGLVLRMPAHRRKIAGTVEHIWRTGTSQKEYKANKRIIGSNIERCFKVFTNSVSEHGKFVLLFAGEGEFIFGDGVYNNLHVSADPLRSPNILYPFTPKIAVFYCVPTSYAVDPKVMTLTLGRQEMEMMNDCIQTYSKDFLFYRTEGPSLTESFKSQAFMEYEWNGDPIARFKEKIATLEPETSALIKLHRFWANAIRSANVR